MIYRKLILVLSIFIITENYCKSQSVYISGKHFGGKSIFITIQDELLNRFTKEMEYDTATNSNQSISISISRPQFIYIFEIFKNKKVGYYPALIFPGDSLEVYYDDTHCWFEGKYKHEYMFVNQMRNIDIYTRDLEVKCIECPNEYPKYKRRRIAYINQMNDSLDFRPTFKTYLEKEVEVSYLWGWLQAYNPYAKNKPKKNISNEYIDSLHALKKIFILDSTLIQTIHYSWYSTYLKFYNRFLAENDYFKNPSLDKQFESAIHNFDGLYRDLLLTLLIKDEILENDINPNHVQIFNEYCLNERYSEHIRHKLDEKLSVASFDKLGNLPLLNTKSKNTQFKEIIDNKITYIDFWASWCKPCREEIPYSKKLKEEYQKKGIKFVYISTDESNLAWQKAIKQMNLPKKESYVVPKGYESEITKKLKIISIPRYIIVDKNGQVINPNAPRPSDPKLTLIFDELLKK